MRFRRLELTAFGSLSGVTLDFTGSGASGGPSTLENAGAPHGIAGRREGLHFIYGPNEAGKSTALRAISALFFGIPERTRDAHSHGTGRLRIGAVIESHDGRILHFVRKKKRKDSLRGPSDEPVQETALIELLGGMTAETFESLFGLDHERLARGGEALLAGEGELGAALFEAKLGGEGTQRLLAELEEEAALLFKPGARTKQVHLALEAHREAVKKWRDLTQRPEGYLAQAERLDELIQRRALIASERKLLRARLARVGRVSAGLPGAKRRAAAQAELREAEAELGLRHCSSREKNSELAGAARLCLQLLGQVSTECERALAQAQRLGLEQSALNAELSNLPSLGDDRDSLAQEVALVRSAKGTRERLLAELTLLESEIERSLRRLPVSHRAQAPEELGLDVERETTLKRLGRSAIELRQEAREAEQRLRLEQEALSELEAALLVSRAASGGVEVVAKLRQLAQRAYVEREVEEALSELSQTEHAVNEAMKRLRPWQGGHKELFELTLPAREVLEQYGERFRESDSHRAKLEARREDVKRSLSDCARRIEGIELGVNVPSEADLVALRRERDEIWRALAPRLEGSSAENDRPSQGGQPGATASGLEAPGAEGVRGLGSRYQALMKQSDEYADRLYREAHRVAEVASLRAERAAHERQLADIDRALAEWARGRGELEQEFEQLTAQVGRPGVGVLEFLAWLKEAERARDRVGILARQQTVLAKRQDELGNVRAELLEVIARAVGSEGGAPNAAMVDAADRPLSELLERGQVLASALQENYRRFEQHKEEVARARMRVKAAAERLAHANRATEAWGHEWTKALGDWPGAHSVEEVLATLDGRGRLLNQLEAKTTKERELLAIDRRAQGLAERVGALISFDDPLWEADEAKHVRADTVRLAEVLIERDRRREKVSDRAEQLRARLAQVQADIARLQAERERLEREVEELCRAAGVEDAEQLFRAERLGERLEGLRNDIRDTERNLVEIAAPHGLSLEDLLKEIQEVEAGTLETEREECEERLEELDREQRDLERDIVGVERGLELFDSDQAAAAAQEVQAKAARVRELAVRYQELSLAAWLLRKEIERYRERHQDPLLSRASVLFRKLTLGSFSGLRVGLEERVLLSVRNDGVEEEVRALSEGTRYQLYLALRLASIEAYLEHHPPMPLVFDDLLLHFDDDRARAALEVLAELSQRTQVLFFTHHEHLLNLARRALKPALRVEHRLGGPTLHGQQELFVHARIS